MPFCASCGSPVEGRFCAKCGSPVQDAAAGVGGSAAAPGPAPAAPPAAAPQYAPASTGMSDSTASGLCYLAGLITGILFLVLEPYSKNKAIRFHAFQSIFLSVAWIAFWFVINIVFTGIGALSLLFLSPLFALAFFVLWLWVMISAFQGKAVSLPVIGPLAKKQA